MTAVQRVNLLLRVSVEVGVVVALADWGVHTGEGTAAKIVLGVAAPLVGFGFWGAVDFHRFRLAEPLRLIQELAISGLAAVAWYAAGRHILGILLGALSIAYHALVYASGQRLLKASREQPTGRSEAMPQAPVRAAVIRPGRDDR
jgi:hypothetical protein